MTVLKVDGRSVRKKGRTGFFASLILFFLFPSNGGVVWAGAESSPANAAMISSDAEDASPLEVRLEKVLDSAQPAAIGAPLDGGQTSCALGVPQNVPAALSAETTSSLPSVATLSEDPYLFRTDVGKISWTCPTPVAAVCDEAVNSCRKLYNGPTVEGGWARMPGCVESRANASDARAKDAGLLGKVEAFTRRRFSEYLADPQFTATCCRTGPSTEGRVDRNCELRLRETRLDYQAAAPEGELGNGEYDLATHAVSAYAPALVQCLNTQCVERFLLHELGHACQYSKALVRSSRYARENPKKLVDRGLFEKLKADSALDSLVSHGTQFCDSPGWGGFGFDEVFGDARGKAVLDALQASAIAHAGDAKKPCLQKWRKEAFADVVFSGWMTSPYHWAYVCRVTRDSAHPKSTEDYLGAFLGTPSPSGSCF